MTRGASKKGSCGETDCLHLATPDVGERTIEAFDLDDGACELERVRVVGAKSAGFQADRALVEDVVFERCDLSTATFRRGSFSRVRFVECKMTGVAFEENVRLDDVAFEKCILDDALFDGAELARVAFAECRLARSGFRASRCEDLAFDGCDLSGADFSGLATARGTHVRLHGCVLAGVALDARLVSSLVVDALGACAVVSALGARISEERVRVSCARSNRRR